MKIINFLLFVFFVHYTTAQPLIIKHLDKSPTIIGSHNTQNISYKTTINQLQPQKYNKIWVDAIQKTVEKSNKLTSKGLDSIGNILENIFYRNAQISPALITKVRQ